MSGVEILIAVALATFVRAFGFDIGLGEVILINVTVTLLAGLMPVSGGVGVTEGGLTFGRVQVGNYADCEAPDRL